jgi:hypothetical protein
VSYDFHTEQPKKGNDSLTFASISKKSQSFTDTTCRCSCLLHALRPPRLAR